MNVFLAHAPADAAFAAELSAFLEAGCDEICIAADSAIQAGQDLLSTAEMTDADDVLVFVLSTASNPARWPREIWEPLVAGRARVGTFLLDECAFPGLLRRGSGFCDGTVSRLMAMRRLKRWIVGIRHSTAPAMAFSPELESLYAALADRPGTMTVSGAVAERFARQTLHDFEAVVWVAGRGRSLAQIAGDLGSQLEMATDGPVDDNCRRLRETLAGRRCLVVFDAPDVAVDAMLPSGRTSVLFTTDAVKFVAERRDFPAARALVVARRFAEAYEILYELFHAGIDTEACARELVWICEHWDRVDEANALRFRFQPAAAEQMRLF